MSDPTIGQVLQTVQRNSKRIKELEQRADELESENERLRAAVPDRGDYTTLDKPTKVAMVQEHLVAKAQNQHGCAAIDYDDVQWGVFDGEPSADHCYTLMEVAATDDGFSIQDVSGENRQLTVDTDCTNTTSGFSPANKANQARGSQ